MTSRFDYVQAERLQYLALFARSIPQLRSYADRIQSMVERMEMVHPGYGRIPVVYTPRSSPRGRLFADGGIASLPKAFRNWLLPDNTVDIDIKTCAPTILHQLAIKEEIGCPELHLFINDYDKKMQDLNNDKELRNAIFFGYMDKGLPEWAQDLQEELRKIVRVYARKEPALMKLAKHEDESDAKEKKKHVTNIEGRFLSFLYQVHENRYLKELDRVGRKYGFWTLEGSMLMFDGITFVPAGTPFDLDVLITEANRRTNMTLALLQKKLLPIADIDIAVPPKPIIIQHYHKEAAEVLRYLNHGIVKHSGQGVWGRMSDRIWVENITKVQDILIGIAMNTDIRIQTRSGINDFTSKRPQAVETAKAVLINPPLDPNFARDVVYRDHRKLHFENGYWLFTDTAENGVFGRFVPGEFESIERIRRNFPSRIQGDIDFVMEKFVDAIFDNMQPGEKDAFLLAIARAIAGEPDKLIHILVGWRDSGKSAFFMLLERALQKLLARIDAAHFSTAKYSGDPTRSNQWVLNVFRSRITVISEQTNADQKASSMPTLSGEGLKKMQSPKEGVEARDLYTNTSRTVYPMTTAFMLVNDLPSVSPPDALSDHGRVYTLRNRFVTKKKKDANAFNRTYKTKNPCIDQWVDDYAYADALLWILIEAYRPDLTDPTESMVESIQQTLNDDGDELIHKIVEVTANPNDFVEQDYIKALLSDRKTGIRINKFTRILQEMIEKQCKQQGTAVFKPDCRPVVNGAQVRGFKGIKRKFNEMY